MKTLYNVFQNPSGFDSLGNYMGDIPDKSWLVLMGRNRDSDILTESNWDVALDMLGGESDTVEIFRFGHWACGWIEYLCVKSGSKAEKKALEIESNLESYPVLDDDHYSNAEYEAANHVWADCYDSQDRIQYIRDNRSQFDFHDFTDLLSCVRGKYFCGYASELLY